MGQMTADIVIEIAFDMDAPHGSVIRTNAKPEALEEILAAWLQDQVGRGKDDRPPARRDVYRIRIGLRIEDDAFGTESDTGNASLTCGIVMEVINLLGRLKVEPFEQDPRYADGQPPRDRP